MKNNHVFLRVLQGIQVYPVDAFDFGVLGRIWKTLLLYPRDVQGLMAPATFVLGLVRTTLGFTGLRVLQGIASAGIAAPAFALAADLAAAGSEGQQMSLITMGFGLGIALGPLIAGLLSPVFFELPFIVGGVLSLAGIWAVYCYVPETVEG